MVTRPEPTPRYRASRSRPTCPAPVRQLAPRPPAQHLPQRPRLKRSDEDQDEHQHPRNGRGTLAGFEEPVHARVAGDDRPEEITLTGDQC